MSKLSEEIWELLNIVNSYDIAVQYVKATGEPTPVYISYRREQKGRAYKLAAWQIHRPGYRTDPDGGYWRDYGNKTFNVFSPRADKARIFAEAVAWANEQYGETEWVKITGPRASGDYFPKEVADWFKQALKAARAAKKKAEKQNVESL